MASVIQRVSNWLLGDYPVATTEIGTGATRKLIQHVHTVDASGSPTSGGDGAVLDGVDPTIKATVKDLSNSNPQAVAVVDGSGDQITSFGGGTQYTEADTDASITGTAMLWEDTSDTLRAVSAAKPLPVAVVSALPAGTNAIGKLAANSGVTIGAVEIAAAQTLATVTTVGAVTAISNALPAGANAIGKLAANSGVDIGDVDVTSVPADPFGANADAASATGSISAKLRFIASTGIPITGTVTVGSHAVTNAGTFAVQVDGAALTSLQLIDDAVYSDDAGYTPGTSKVLGIGLQADETATDSVDEGDMGAPRMTLDRKVIVTPQPHTGGGLSIFRSIDLDEGTLEVVKNSAGCIYGMWITNTATATRWVKFYDATSGTLGTGTPVITFGIPGNASDDLAGLFGSGHGIAFATGICVGAGTGVADNDTGAPGANDIIINVFYK